MNAKTLGLFGAERWDEETVYSNRTREELLENDELEAFEEGFMRGWDEAY